MKASIFIACLLSILCETIQAQTRWSFEMHGGGVWNVPMPLTIRQNGQPEISISSRFHTEPFTLPFYEDARLIRWKGNNSWEFEFLHHKLYLNNTTAEIQKYNISHGFNMLMINRGFNRQKFQWRYGAGIILAHPESKIRDKIFGDSENDWDLGYSVSGPVVNIAVGRRIYFTRQLYLNAEAKSTFAYSRIKIAEGNSDVWNLAFHLIFGIGADFVKISKN